MLTAKRFGLLFLMLVASWCAHGEQMDSVLVSEGVQDGIRLRFELEKAHYHLCEPIPLKYTKTSDTKTFRGYMIDELSRCLYLVDINGKELESREFTRNADFPLVSELSGTYDLELDNYNVDIDVKWGKFRHIKPGKYEIRYRCDPPMPPLVFYVDRLPDSLRYVWNNYSKLSLICHSRLSLDLSKREALDQAEGYLEFFEERPTGSMFRIEGLWDGMQIIVKNWTAWTAQDSVASVKLLDAYQSEPDAINEALLGFARVAVFKGMKGETLAEHIRIYAESTGDAELVEDANKFIRRILEDVTEE